MDDIIEKNAKERKLVVMRRAEREVIKPEEILSVIDKCMVCRLGLWDGEKVYIVPMNFGHTFENGVLNLYFHGAGQGRKYEILSKYPQVAFEMDCGHGLDAGGDIACTYGYYFASVVGSGTAEIVTDKEEKKKALSVLMEHQTGRNFNFDDRQAASVTVLKVTAEEYSCKRRAKEE